MRASFLTMPSSYVMTSALLESQDEVTEVKQAIMVKMTVKDGQMLYLDSIILVISSYLLLSVQLILSVRFSYKDTQSLSALQSNESIIKTRAG